MSIISLNKYAKFKYTIGAEYEAGLVLNGRQVKAIRAKNFNIRDSIIRIKKGEFWIMNLNFADQSVEDNIKLLFSQKEINKLIQIADQKMGYLVPLNFHFKGHLIKLQVGIGKHKREFDKRDSIRKADDMREIQKELKNIKNY